jgi:hypothetical protein
LKNNELNKGFSTFETLGLSKLSRFFSMDVVTLRKCLQFAIEIVCRDLFPSCDRTQSVLLEQKICRESCLETTRICSKMYRFLFNYYTEQHPESEKQFRCELQPYRNAGDSPECYYVNGLANTPGTIQGPVVRKSDNFTHCMDSDIFSRCKDTYTQKAIKLQTWAWQLKYQSLL